MEQQPTQQQQDNCLSYDGHDDDEAAAKQPQQEYEEEYDEEEFLPPPNMRLTGEELEWALELKHQVMEDEELEERSDFEYAMVTLICMDDLEEAKIKLQGLQDFRKEYGVNDNALEGIELVMAMIQQQPWFVLDVAVNTNTSSSEDTGGGDDDSRRIVLVQDFSKFHPSKVKSPTDWRVFLGGFYYLLQLLQPDLASIREGMLVLAELDGMGWENFDLRVLNQHYHHLMEYYPVVIKETHFFHSSVIGSMLLSLIKKLRTDYSLSSPIEYGKTLTGGSNTNNGVIGGPGGNRLEQMFKTPTPEIAQGRLISKCAEYLSIRYKNQESYRLLPDEE